MLSKLKVLFSLLLLVAVAVGCDSNEDDPSDAERFVGNWQLTALSDAGGDKLAAFSQAANSLTANLTASNQFTIVVDYKEELGLEDQTIAGTYQVQEGARQLVLIPPGGQQIPFAYEFEEDDVVELSVQSVFVNALFGTEAYTGTVRLTIEK